MSDCGHCGGKERCAPSCIAENGPRETRSDDFAPRPPFTRKEFATDNARLRVLIKAAEEGTEYACPWCCVTCCDPHKPDCQAFTPDGDVK